MLVNSVAEINHVVKSKNAQCTTQSNDAASVMYFCRLVLNQFYDKL